MPPRRGFKLQEYAQHLYDHCPGLSTVNKIHADLRYIKGIISGRRINHDLPCTGGEGRLCQILDDLTLWNEFLWLVDAQLQEVTPGVLGVVCLHGICAAPVYDNIARRHACMLLHWLVKEHRCVRVLELEETVIPRSHHLFCDMLRVSAELRRLKLSNYYFKGAVSKTIVEAIGSLKVLEELEFSKVNLSTDALTVLASLLRDMKSLRSFSFHQMSLEESTAQLLYESLGMASNLKSLHLGDIRTPTKVKTDFAEYLAQHPALEELTFKELSYHGTVSVEPISRMLEQNTVLKRLHLSGLHLDQSEAQLLVRAMSKNVTLESLVIDDTFWKMDTQFLAELVERNTGLKELALPFAQVSCITPFVEAIQKNATLQKLTLRVPRINATEAEMFLQAVASNRSLEHVNLGTIGSGVVKDFCRILKETGTETRVTYKTSFGNPMLCSDTLSTCRNIANISLLLTYNVAIDPAVLCGLFDQLKVCHRLARLSISRDGVIDDASVASLARFVSSAKALKKLGLYFETTKSTLPVLLEALSHNKSVSKLFLNPCVFSHTDAQMLRTVLKASMTLNDLTIEVSHISETEEEVREWDDPTLAILQHLPRCLSQNFTVIHVDIAESQGGERAMFHVKDTMRRNLSLLQRAAQFAMGVRNKLCAEAFERVHQSEALVQKLRELAHVTEAEAREKIRCSLRDLDGNFLVMAGVVKREVVCVGPTPGQITLDRIGIDNWLRIRSYLKVGDILNDSVPEDPKALAQRRRVRKRKLQVSSS